MCHVLHYSRGAPFYSGLGKVGGGGGGDVVVLKQGETGDVVLIKLEEELMGKS